MTQAEFRVQYIISCPDCRKGLMTHDFLCPNCRRCFDPDREAIAIPERIYLVHIKNNVERRLDEL